MYLSNVGTEVNATITTHPFTVYLPPQLTNNNNAGPSVVSMNSTYSNLCDTSSQWSLNFSIDITNFITTSPYPDITNQPGYFYQLGTRDFYLTNLRGYVLDTGLPRSDALDNAIQFLIGSSPIYFPGTNGIPFDLQSWVAADEPPYPPYTGNFAGILYACDLVVSPQLTPVLLESPLLDVQFNINAGNLSPLINNLPVGEFYALFPGRKEVVAFSDVYTDATGFTEFTKIPLSISNIQLALPLQFFTPTLQYYLSSPSLLPFLTPETTTTARFQTPHGLIPTGADAPVIVLNQMFSNEIQTTKSYVVTQTGLAPAPTLTVTPPFLPITYIKEYVPFSYYFAASDYYPLPDSAPHYSNVGANQVSITGTTNVTIGIPTGSVNIQVLGDRRYEPFGLYENSTTLSIDIPLFTSPLDSVNIGFQVYNRADQVVATGLLMTITTDNSTTNTVSIPGQVPTVSYQSASRLVFVPGDLIINPDPMFPVVPSLFAYLVDGYGTSNLIGTPLPASYGASIGFSMQIESATGYAGPSTSVVVHAPSNSQIYRSVALAVSLDPAASGTTFLTPYTIGQGGRDMSVSSVYGFSNITDPPVVWRVIATYKNILLSLETVLAVLRGSIIANPPITSSNIYLNIYSPFSYQFDVPVQYGNTTLISYNSDAVIRQFTTGDTTTRIVFSSTVGFTYPVSNALLSIQAVEGGDIVQTTNYYFTVSGNIITSVPPFAGSITLYKYEPFSYAYGLVPGVANVTLSAAASSAEVRAFVTPTTPGTTLTYGGTYKLSYANTLNLIVSAISGGLTVAQLSNAVTVNPGRFSNPVNTTFSFYQNEDISVTYGSNIPFDTAASLDSLPASTPALPVGLSFSSVAGSSNNFILKGTPRFQSPLTRYLILGLNNVLNQVVTTRISMTVNPPRIQITPPSLVVSGMQIGVPITPVTFTSIQPAALTSRFEYTWDVLPDGIVFQDILGNVVTQPFIPTDANLSLVLAGTPTSNAAYSFVNAGITTSNVTLYTFQYQPNGVKTNQKAVISFSFAETILFSNTVVSNVYATQPLTPTSIIIKAASYFPTGDAVVSITAPLLPNGLSLSNTITGIPNYVNGVDYADGVFLSGTPTTVSSAYYSFVATTTNGFMQILDLLIPILQDVVTFTSVTPASASFIVSRPITLDYNLIFTAVSAIPGQTVVYTTSFDLIPYGLRLTVANGSATLTGTPTNPLSSTPLIITATDPLGTFASVSIQITINPDTFTFNSPALNFIQHVPITPVQFTATTSSQREVISFISSDLPAGLSLSASGILTGTPTTSSSGSFNIVASTGYLPGSPPQLFNYAMVPDSIIVLLTANPLFIPSAIFSVDAFRGLTYSGHTPTLTVDQASIQDKDGGTNLLPTLSISGTVLTGSFPEGAEAYSPFSFNVIASYLNTTATLGLHIYYNGSTGQLTTNTSSGSLVFTSPGSTNYLFYQHCPIPPIVFRISGATGFTYFYTVVSNLPVGLIFTPDPSGTFATLSGTPALFNDALVGVTIYAVNNGNITFQTIQIRVITPFFVNPQSSGSSAYTAILRNQVIVNGSQNARDSVVYPMIDASLGSLQSPGAPDVKSPPVPCCDVKIK